MLKITPNIWFRVGGPSRPKREKHFPRFGLEWPPAASGPPESCPNRYLDGFFPSFIKFHCNRTIFRGVFRFGGTSWDLLGPPGTPNGPYETLYLLRRATGVCDTAIYDRCVYIYMFMMNVLILLLFMVFVMSCDDCNAEKIGLGP